MAGNEHGEGMTEGGLELVLLEDEDKKARAVFAAREMNFIGQDALKLLRSKKVGLPFFSSSFLRFYLSISFLFYFISCQLIPQVELTLPPPLPLCMRVA
jgi:hypothetical protein